jgi:hypothetical protein
MWKNDAPGAPGWLAELRTQLPAGLERFERRQFDLPRLVEVWMAGSRAATTQRSACMYSCFHVCRQLSFPHQSEEALLSQTSH